MRYVSPPNHGVLSFRDQGMAPDEPATLIVTGVARSGTSMVAGVLRDAGVFMGQYVFDVVQEDAEILTMLQSGQEPMLQALIAQRNEAHVSWGFKVPNLHAYLRADRLSLFRNPRLIVVFRDPVAVAVRDALSEHFDPQDSLDLTAHAMVSLIAFAQRAGCPTLMVSYEKAITAPEAFLRSLLPFCGIDETPDLMDRLMGVVEPNNPAYLATANTQFTGYVEGVLSGQVYGWCRQWDTLTPVSLDVFADDRLLMTVLADHHRADLAANGIGNGDHGFYVDLNGRDLPPDAVLRIRPHRRSVELEGSGRTIAALIAAHPGAEAVSPDPAPAAAPGLAAAR